MSIVTLNLPYPPTCNTYYRHTGGRTLLSRRGRAYREAVGGCVLLQAPRQRLNGDLSIMIRLQPPDRRRRDIDNTLKAVLDSLLHPGLYDDDSQIVALRVYRDPPVQCGAAQVILANYS